MSVNVIDSVLGFNLKTEIFDNEGNPIKTGAKAVINVNAGVPNVGTKIGAKTWFTNYNDGLLQKIRDYKNLNL
jgi:hypothetical protein